MVLRRQPSHFSQVRTPYVFRNPQTATPYVWAYRAHNHPVLALGSKPVVVRLPSQAKKVKLRLEIRLTARLRTPPAVPAPLRPLYSKDTAPASRPYLYNPSLTQTLMTYTTSSY
jgi:hypothetical protein